MKKLLIIFALLFLPTMSLAGNSMANTVSEMTETIKKETGVSVGGGSSGVDIKQIWQDIKNDPIGQLKYYWNKLVGMIIDGYEAARDKINEMLN